MLIEHDLLEWRLGCQSNVSLGIVCNTNCGAALAAVDGAAPCLLQAAMHQEPLLPPATGRETSLDGLVDLKPLTTNRATPQTPPGCKDMERSRSTPLDGDHLAALPSHGSPSLQPQPSSTFSSAPGTSKARRTTPFIIGVAGGTASGKTVRVVVLGSHMLQSIDPVGSPLHACMDDVWLLHVIAAQLSPCTGV